MTTVQVFWLNLGSSIIHFHSRSVFELAFRPRPIACIIISLKCSRLPLFAAQFAGGFDPESMQAFEALRACASRPNNPPAQEYIEEGEEEEDEGEQEEHEEQEEQ
jgi:hypothetical protein